MSELDRLHADVLARPEADEPRVAYAAAVAARDPDRAELIRVQLQLAHSRKRGGSPGERADGYSREEILLNKHKDVWARDVTAVPGVQFIKFWRGFVDQVRMAAPAFLTNGKRVFEYAPVLHLDFTDLAPVARQVFASPLLAQVRSMRLSGIGLGDETAIAIAESPQLGQLCWLDLTRNHIGQAGIEAIAASKNLPNLRYLGFSDNSTTDPTPQVAETDNGEVVRLEVPDAGRALEARFGAKAWLSSDFIGTLYPPERDVYD